MTITKRLRVAKCPAYVWRVHAWGMGENLNWIDCWYVVDEQNLIIAGGYHSGSNVSSGYAQIPRKKEAVAFVEGFHWAQEHFEQLSRESYYCVKGVDNPYSYSRTRPHYDEDMETMFMNGASEAYERLVERKVYGKPPALPANATVLAKHYVLKPPSTQKAAA